MTYSNIVNRRHVSIRKDLHARVQELADSRGLDVSPVVELALVELLESFGMEAPNPDGKDRALRELKRARLQTDRPCAACLGTGIEPPQEPPP